MCFGEASFNDAAFLHLSISAFSDKMSLEIEHFRLADTRKEYDFEETGLARLVEEDTKMSSFESSPPPSRIGRRVRERQGDSRSLPWPVASRRNGEEEWPMSIYLGQRLDEQKYEEHFVVCRSETW